MPNLFTETDGDADDWMTEDEREEFEAWENGLDLE